jgi:hypothetical protein
MPAAVAVSLPISSARIASGVSDLRGRTCRLRRSSEPSNTGSGHDRHRSAPNLRGARSMGKGAAPGSPCRRSCCFMRRRRHRSRFGSHVSRPGLCESQGPIGARAWASPRAAVVIGAPRSPLYGSVPTDDPTPPHGRRCSVCFCHCTSRMLRLARRGSSRSRAIFCASKAGVRLPCGFAEFQDLASIRPNGRPRSLMKM